MGEIWSPERRSAAGGAPHHSRLKAGKIRDLGSKTEGDGGQNQALKLSSRLLNGIWVVAGDRNCEFACRRASADSKAC